MRVIVTRRDRDSVIITASCRLPGFSEIAAQCRIDDLHRDVHLEARGTARGGGGLRVSREDRGAGQSAGRNLVLIVPESVGAFNPGAVAAKAREGALRLIPGGDDLSGIVSAAVR